MSDIKSGFISRDALLILFKYILFDIVLHLEQSKLKNQESISCIN